jgi:predicted nucleotidyltransferase
VRRHKAARPLDAVKGGTVHREVAQQREGADAERLNVDGLAVLLVVVVAQAPDEVDVAALAQVLGGVLGLLAPQRPLDRGGFLLAAVALTLNRPGIRGGCLV